LEECILRLKLKAQAKQKKLGFLCWYAQHNKIHTIYEYSVFVVIFSLLIFCFLQSSNNKKASIYIRSHLSMICLDLALYSQGSLCISSSEAGKISLNKYNFNNLYSRLLWQVLIWVLREYQILITHNLPTSALVRQRLEYASCVWDLIYNRFLRNWSKKNW
jgi:hypothetical protein